MEAAMKQIIDDLNLIKTQLNDIKETMPDKEMFLSADESKLLEESYSSEKKGTLVSSKDLRKQLGL